MRTIVPNEVIRRVKEGPVPGVVPVIERQANGDNVVKLDKPLIRPDGTFTEPVAVPVPQEMQQRMFTGLPADVRRTARERYVELLRCLWTDANLHFYKDGEIRWPRSVQDEIAVIGIAQGKPHLREQVESLARRYIEKGARQQKEQDAKRVTLDWHGHYSA